MVFVFQTVASRLHKTEIEMKVIKDKTECDHIQFLITEKNRDGESSHTKKNEIKILSKGTFLHIHMVRGKLCVSYGESFTTYLVNEIYLFHIYKNKKYKLYACNVYVILYINQISSLL